MSKYVWKQYCNKCKKHHYVTMQPCPSCEIYHTPQPVKDKVLEKHDLYTYECEGCQAYREHLK